MSARGATDQAGAEPEADTVRRAGQTADEQASGHRPTGRDEQASGRRLTRRAGQTFRAFRVRNFRLFWFGQLVSMTGTWMQSIAQAWLVLRLTDSPLALGGVMMLQTLPVLLFGLFGGIVADRVPKRRLLMVTQSVMLLQAVGLGLLTWAGLIQLWHVYAGALVLGTMTALDNPARQAFISEIVDLDDLQNAVSLNSLLFNSARLVGPALGGVTIALIGIAGCFFLNALSFVGFIGGLLLMRASELHHAPSGRRGAILGQIGEGLRYAVTTPDVALVVILMGTIGMFGYNFTVLLPLVAEYVLDADAIGFGALTSAMALGSVAASLVLAGSKQPTRRRLFVGAACFSVLLFSLSLATSWTVASLLLVLIGGFGIVFTSTANVWLQTTTPPALRGRVMSIYTLLFLGTSPIGSLVVGTLAEYAGVRVTIATMGLVCCLGVAAALVYGYRTAHRAAEARVQAPAAGA